MLRKSRAGDAEVAGNRNQNGLFSGSGAAQQEKDQEYAAAHERFASGRKLRFLLPPELMQERLGIAVGLVTALEHQCAGSLESDA